MTVFDTRFATSGFPRLLADMGEAVTYKPRGGGSRAITAIVTRDPPAFYEGEKVVIPAFTLRVYNDSTTGVRSDELDTGGDCVALLMKISDTQTETRPIIKMLSQDSGVTTFAVR